MKWGEEGSQKVRRERVKGHRGQRTHLRNHIRRLLEVRAAPHRVRLGEVVLDEAQADVVPHLVELLVDLHVVRLVVAT